MQPDVVFSQVAMLTELARDITQKIAELMPGSG